MGKKLSVNLPDQVWEDLDEFKEETGVEKGRVVKDLLEMYLPKIKEKEKLRHSYAVKKLEEADL